jgi:hypothetical protein
MLWVLSDGAQPSKERKMIKFNKYCVTDGTTKARVFYSNTQMTDGRQCVTLYAKDYDRRLGKIFAESYQNETDGMTDYFDKGLVRIFPDNPMYADALARCK